MPLIYIHGVRQRNPKGLERLKTRFEALVGRIREGLGRIEGGRQLPANFSVSAHHWGALSVPTTPTSIIPALGRRDERSLESFDAADDSWALPDEELFELELGAELPADLHGDGGMELLQRLALALPDQVRAKILEEARRDLTPAESEQLRGRLSTPGGLQGLLDEARMADALPENELEVLESFTGALEGARSLGAGHASPGAVLRRTLERTAAELALKLEGVRGLVGTTQVQLALFLGDATKVVQERERRGAESPILRLFLDELKQDKDEPLIVITHSAGGLIAYDCLTHFLPKKRVDCLITVGGQISQFHLLGLTATQLAPDGSGRVSGLSSRIRRWVNICDPLDPLCFWAEPAFADARDVEFRTGHGPSSAHAAYWKIPAFYELLEREIIDALRPA